MVNSTNSLWILKKKLWNLLFITAIVMFPFPVFIIILYSEPILNVFFSINSTNSVLQNEVPGQVSKFFLYFTSLFAISAALISIIVLFIYIYLFKGWTKTPHFFHSSIMFGILAIIIISIILFTVSEIRYDFIISWCDNIRDNYSEDNPLVIQNGYGSLTALFKQIQSYDKNSMHWVDYKNALWLSGIEISVICITFINFQLKAFSNITDVNAVKRIEKLYNRESFGETKEKQFFQRFLIPTPKNIAIFAILVSIIALAPSLIFLLKITLFDNTFSQIIRLSYIEPMFSKIHIPYDANQYYIFYDEVISQSPAHSLNEITILLYIPQIFLVLSISFTIAFIFFIVNNKMMSINFLMWLIIILWMLVIFTSIFIFYSSFTLNAIVTSWEQGINTGNYELFKTYIYDLNIWDGNINKMMKCWFNQNESISLLILELSLFTSISVICISQIFKAKKQKVTNAISTNI